MIWEYTDYIEPGILLAEYLIFIFNNFRLIIKPIIL